MQMLLILAGALFAQATCQPSARAIFLGQTGAIAPTAAQQCTAPRPVEPPTAAKKANTNPTGITRGSAPATGPTVVKVANAIRNEDISKMSALKFWIELIKPNGEKERVTTDRVFHSGERFQIHLESSVTGRLSVYQRTPNGSLELLFPDRAVDAGDNLVKSQVETLIPPKGRIKFDDTPGAETMVIVLNPLISTSGTQVAAEAVPSQEQVRSVLQTASTRGFVLESDNQPGKEAEYAASTGTVALEIKLKHQ